MKTGIIGRFYKTKKLAFKEVFRLETRAKEERKYEIVEFAEGYLVISSDQLPQLV